MPLAVTGNLRGAKTGSSSATFVLGMCFGGDASTLAAAKSQDITRVFSVDVKRSGIPFIFERVTTIVNGYQDTVPVTTGQP